MRYLAVRNMAVCFFSLLMKRLFKIATVPAFPFHDAIFKAIPFRFVMLLSTNEEFEIVMFDFPPVVITSTAPSTDVCIFLLNLESSIITVPPLCKTCIAVHLELFPFHFSTVTFFRVKYNSSGIDSSLYLCPFPVLGFPIAITQPYLALQ